MNVINSIKFMLFIRRTYFWHYSDFEGDFDNLCLYKGASWRVGLERGITVSTPFPTKEGMLLFILV